jgi:plastocyanin
MSASRFQAPVFNFRICPEIFNSVKKRLKPFVVERSEPSMSSQGSTLVGAVVAVLIIGAVGTLAYYQVEVAPNQGSTSNTTSTPAVTCPSRACVNVTIPVGASAPPNGWTGSGKTTYGFTPDTVTLVIGKNNTVFWTNNDASIHTATSDAAGGFDTGNLNQGQSAQFTFTTPGTYTYHCTYHAWMQGTIIVKSG